MASISKVPPARLTLPAAPGVPGLPVTLTMLDCGVSGVKMSDCNMPDPDWL